MLLQIGQEILQIRPNQIIEVEHAVDNNYLKPIQASSKKGRKRNGSSMQTDDNKLRE